MEMDLQIKFTWNILKCILRTALFREQRELEQGNQQDEIWAEKV